MNDFATPALHSLPTQLPNKRSSCCAMLHKNTIRFIKKKSTFLLLLFPVRVEHGAVMLVPVMFWRVLWCERLESLAGRAPCPGTGTWPGDQGAKSTQGS